MQTLVAEILAAWRRAERLSHELPEGSAERGAAHYAAERLQALYRDLTQSGIVKTMTEAEARTLLQELTK
ncbi:MAG TPA: hypothetical protein VGJ46_07285 [Candidatus Limnocylindrales bacterium]|jgi:hypothetical protein